MKRILLVVPSNKGTIAMCSLNLWKALRQAPDVKVCCVLVYKLADGIEDFNNCPVLSSGKKGLISKALNLFCQANRLKSIKKEFMPDMTISTLLNCSTVSLLSGGREKKVGIFHSPHQQVKAKGKLLYWNTLAEYRFLYPKLDYLACVSEEVKQSILHSFRNILPHKVGVIYNVHLINEIYSKAKEKLDSSEDETIFANKVMLYCGRLDVNKAPDRLMRAFVASGAYNRYHLVFMGNDEGPGNLVLNMAKQKHIEDRVHLIGLRRNPYKYIAKSDVLVSSSYSEGLPGVIIEALTLGIPVITTNSSRGVWEIFGCSNQYDKKMKGLKVVPDGIITSNTGDDKYDDEMLAKAIGNFRKEEFTVPFSFADKVSAETIAKQFLELL